MNDNRNYTPAGQPVTQPLYNGQPVYTAPQNPAPVQNPTPAYTYPPQGGNGAPFMHSRCSSRILRTRTAAEVGGPRAFGAKGAAPRGLRLSFATMTSLPIQVLWTTLATLILTVCGVNFMGPKHHWRLSADGVLPYFVHCSVLSCAAVLVFSVLWEKKALGHGACGEKRCAEQCFARLCGPCRQRFDEHSRKPHLAAFGGRGAERRRKHGRPFGR